MFTQPNFFNHTGPTLQPMRSYVDFTKDLESLFRGNFDEGLWTNFFGDSNVEHSDVGGAYI